MRDPGETIVRNVLLFPANGGTPAITPMTFSEAGSRSNPCGFYMVNVDLRGLYGEDNMYATRKEPCDIIDERSDGGAGGKYDLFHNISPALPINVAMARLVDVDPEKPGKRPLWRGDVVVVKRDEWPIKVSPGLPMDYRHVPVHISKITMCGTEYRIPWDKSAKQPERRARGGGEVGLRSPQGLATPRNGAALG
ncbi:hypothetical protein B0H15DRAFT_982340 [Mycena belliarum]|uniref:Uncharacterized protein n=1 Tax=Mycena belliarum TaxID=1033014 RepID=A0AAD6U8J6_9AGAR|nr:hypothetical protein B0H15DRAFT_982340 [Mycena belliae]